MKSLGRMMLRAAGLLAITVGISVRVLGAQTNAPAFAIRGMLPWHNFLSGPSAWNESDYVQYFDRMKALGLNYITFHCYTGGAERYVTYVEPIIRIQYRNISPYAYLDTSTTDRWGYRPMPVSEFLFGTEKAFQLPAGANAFGADCAVLATNNEDRYKRTQALMRRVIDLAHERGIQVGIGFEFGIHPPEFASVVPQNIWIRGTMLPDPTHATSIEIMRSTIDNVLETYPGVDWVWLWLQELSMSVGKPSFAGPFREIMQRDWQYFQDASNEDAMFTGVWALTYIRQAREYLAKRAPKVRMAISGWGGGTQLSGTLRGLDRGLPPDVVFTCLNPNQGWDPQPDVMEEIAKKREVWAIPWLEGDARLWHLQPRVAILREQIQLAQKQKLRGVLGIHWRTEEMRANMNALAQFAVNPAAAPTVDEFYLRDCQEQYGPAAAEVAAKLVFLDKEQAMAAYSPEYYPYDPGWGRLHPALRTKLAKDAEDLARLTKAAADPKHQKNLDWLLANYQFTLLLDSVSENLEAAYRLKDRWYRGDVEASKLADEVALARKAFNAAPVEEMFRTFARRVRSRGELGELSSINQKVGQQYLELKRFLFETLKP